MFGVDAQAILVLVVIVPIEFADTESYRFGPGPVTPSLCAVLLPIGLNGQLVVWRVSVVVVVVVEKKKEELEKTRNDGGNIVVVVIVIVVVVVVVVLVVCT